MKLSPPASSSDLDAAREIARRLHEQRRQAERPAQHAPLPRRPTIPPAPAGARLDVMPSPPSAARSQHAAPERPPRPTPVAPPVPEPPPLPLAPPRVIAPPRPIPVPPAQHEARPAVEPPLPPAQERRPSPVPAPPVAHEPAPAPWDDEPSEAPTAGEPEDPLADFGDASPPPGGDAADQPDDDDAIEIEETNATLEDIVGSADLPSDEEIVGPPDLEPDAPVDDADAYEPSEPANPYTATASPFDEGPSIESMSEELFDLPSTPSWGEVVENCLMIAHARGAMLVDPSGQVLASNGFWPEPGPDPIAKKLVAMMEKTLKDAPTRSVSAPVGAMHLTAWRVPLAEGLITVAFLGDTPLRAEARTPVDAEILRGAP